MDSPGYLQSARRIGAVSSSPGVQDFPFFISLYIYIYIYILQRMVSQPISLVALRGTKGSSNLHHGFGVPSVREKHLPMTPVWIDSRGLEVRH